MITLNQHRANITSLIMRKYEDTTSPKFGFASFFPTETTSAKEIGIEVRRGTKKVAVDVNRSSNANLNSFSKSTEKLYTPPYYNEGFDFSQLDHYLISFGRQSAPTESDAINMIRTANDKLQLLKDKINRAIELQRAHALQTGIVPLKNGDNIDYKRKAASKVALSGTATWDNVSSSSPFEDLKKGAEFIRNVGRSSGNIIDAFFGSEAFHYFMSNDKTQKESNLRRIDRISLNDPRYDDTTGLAVHGSFSVGDFIIRVWTYSETYENESGVEKPYLEANNVVMLPSDFSGFTGFAGVPAITRDLSNAEFPEFITRVETDFYITNYILQQSKAHMFEISSAPLVVPVSVDKIFTLKVK